MHMVAPSDLCKVMCDCFVGCCLSSYLLIDYVSMSKLMSVVENVRLCDFYPLYPPFNEFSRGVRLRAFLGGLVLCL
jgi:hypothetical protein